MTSASRVHRTVHALLTDEVVSSARTIPDCQGSPGQSLMLVTSLIGYTNILYRESRTA